MTLKWLKLTCGSENTCWMVLMGPQGTPVPSKHLSHLAVDSSENLRERGHCAVIPHIEEEEK